MAFTLDARDLSYWSTTTSGWVHEPGDFTLSVGASSRDVRLTITVDVTAPPLAVPLGAMATLHEWLADPSGSAALRQAIGTDGEGRPLGVLGNEQLLAVIGSAPISTLAAFPGLGLDHEILSDLLQRPPAQPR